MLQRNYNGICYKMTNSVNFVNLAKRQNENNLILL